jgi:hypothetical protein
MSKLQSNIESLAFTFAASVLATLRAASVEELLDITGARSSGGGGSGVGNGRQARAAVTSGGRLRRRSSGDLGAMVSNIVSALAKHEAGLRSEELRAALGVERKELPRPLKEALATGVITKMGEKRGTVYFAGAAPKRSPANAKKSAAKK